MVDAQVIEFGNHAVVKNNGPFYNSRGHRLQFLNKIDFFFSEDHFVLANSVDPDEMPHFAALNLGLLCLQL